MAESPRTNPPLSPCNLGLGLTNTTTPPPPPPTLSLPLPPSPNCHHHHQRLTSLSTSSTTTIYQLLVLRVFKSSDPDGIHSFQPPLTPSSLSTTPSLSEAVAAPFIAKACGLPADLLSRCHTIDSSRFTAIITASLRSAITTFLYSIHTKRIRT